MANNIIKLIGWRHFIDTLSTLFIEKDNIKTINGQSLVGTGNITISGGSGSDSRLDKLVKIADSQELFQYKYPDGEIAMNMGEGSSGDKSLQIKDPEGNIAIKVDSDKTDIKNVKEFMASRILIKKNNSTDNAIDLTKSTAKFSVPIHSDNDADVHGTFIAHNKGGAKLFSVNDTDEEHDDAVVIKDADGNRIFNSKGTDDDKVLVGGGENHPAQFDGTEVTLRGTERVRIKNGTIDNIDIVDGERTVLKGYEKQQIRLEEGKIKLRYDDNLDHYFDLLNLKNGFKTVNGNSILGRGNINIQGGNTLSRFREDTESTQVLDPNGYRALSSERSGGDWVQTHIAEFENIAPGGIPYKGFAMSVYDSGYFYDERYIDIHFDAYSLNFKRLNDLRITFEKSGIELPFSSIYSPITNINKYLPFDNYTFEEVPDEELTLKYIGDMFEKTHDTGMTIILHNNSYTKTYVITPEEIVLSAYPIFKDSDELDVFIDTLIYGTDPNGDGSLLCYVFNNDFQRFELRITSNSESMGGDYRYRFESSGSSCRSVSIQEALRKLSEI